LAQADARDATAETAADRAAEAMADVRLQLTSGKQHTEQLMASVTALNTELAQAPMDDRLSAMAVAEAVATRMDQLQSVIEELQELSQSQQQSLARTTSAVTGLAAKVEATPPPPPPPSPGSSHATAAEVAQLQAATLTLEAQVNIRTAMHWVLHSEPTELRRLEEEFHVSVHPLYSRVVSLQPSHCLCTAEYALNSPHGKGPSHLHQHRANPASTNN